MAALYGRLQGQAGEATRQGNKDSGIRSVLETWHGSVETWLNADGTFTVSVGPKHGPRQEFVTGKVEA